MPCHIAIRRDLRALRPQSLACALATIAAIALTDAVLAHGLGEPEVLDAALLGVAPDRGAPVGFTFVRILTGDIVNDGGFSFGHAWGDYDDDGCFDLIVNNIVAGQSNLVYHNDCDGSFTKLVASTLVELGPSSSSTWGDYDNDGALDLFVANGGTGGTKANYLYRNLGGGSFTKITSGDLVTQVISSTATSWVDIENDGDLDLFVGRSGGGANQLFLGDGAGTFTETLLPDGGGTWGVFFADTDDDGDMDAFCANWQIPNYLYRNDAGTLVRVLAGPVVQGSSRSLSGSFGDYDGDGDLDLFVSNSAARDRLFRNDGAGGFTEILDVPMVIGVANSESSAWADLDQDGDLDLLVSAGGNQSIGMNALYANDGDGTFTEVSGGEIVTQEGRYEGLTTVDYDNDGDLDVFLSNYNDLDNVLYRHEGAIGAFVNIRCIGQVSNRSAIGARVEVTATIGSVSRTQVREVTSHTGHVAESDGRIHVGLGDATVIDEVTIRWPSGAVDVHETLAVNGFYAFVEGVVVSVGDSDGPAPGVSSRAVPNPFAVRTTVSFRLPSPGSATVVIFDVAGRVLTKLASGARGAGVHALEWDGCVKGRPLRSGVYLYRVEIVLEDGRRTRAEGRIVRVR